MKFIFKSTFQWIGPLAMAGLLTPAAWGGAPSGYHLVWGDEFNGESINPVKWNWGALPWGGRHHNDSYSSYITPEDSYLSNGSLVLRCRQGDFGGYPWSEGFVHSNGRFRYRYGYVEIRARFPVARGTWPAFWTLSDGWPPEFDIAEYFGDDNRMHMGLAYGSCCPVNWDSANLYNEGFDQWHTYGLEWGPGFARWYLDGAVRKSITSNYVPDQDMYLILNSGMTWGFDGTTPNPNYTEIDYCRVYAPGPSTPPTLSDVSSRSTPLNTPTPPLPLVVGDAETPLDELILSAASGNTSLVPVQNIVFSGAGANRTVTVTPLSGQSGSSLITLRLSDGEFTVSETFTLTVGGTNQSPVLSPLGDIVIRGFHAVGGRIFGVNDAETPPDALQLTATTSNPAVVPLDHIEFTGNFANRTVLIRPVPGLTGSSVVDVTLSDGELSAHDRFLVTILDEANLVKNPGFENGLTGWSRIFGGAVGSRDSSVFEGNACGTLTGRGERWHGLGTSLLGRVADGGNYRCEAWVRLAGASSDTVSLTVRVDDDSGVHYFSVVQGRASSGGWTRVSGTVQLDFVGDPNEVTLYVEGPASGVDIWVDNVSLRPIDRDELVPFGAEWKYRDDGVPPDATWTAVEYADEAWPSGSAPLGYGDGDEMTVLEYGPNAGDKYVTSWFRHSFVLSNPWAWEVLQLSVLRDDGAVVYLNGVEIFRSNLADGPVAPAALALTAVGGSDENTQVYVTAVDPTVLRPGLNVLAVEVHQAAPDSSDVSFDLQLYGLPPEPDHLVNAGSPWRYSDLGSNYGSAWTTPGFRDLGWKLGFAPLGYGDGDENTVVGFGGDAANKHITTYFRHAFEVPDPHEYRQFLVRLQRDDGAVVHLNGAEIFRSNLPLEEPIVYTTRAGNAGDDGNDWQEARVARDHVVAGRNLLAVEVHQTSPTSSDMSFDLELVGYSIGALPELRATVAGGGLWLDWPAWAVDYGLMESGDPASAASWVEMPAPNVRAASGRLNLLVPQLRGTRFYRLERFNKR